MKKIFLLFPFLLLAACTGTEVKETLGMERQSPDEFRVVSRPPLSLPPDFNTLPQPSTGNEDRIGQQDASRTAQTLITGTTPATVKASAADQQFLNKAGADKIDTSARSQLREEREAATKEKSMLESFAAPNPRKDPVVDATKEAARLKQNQASGKPVTAGETPEVKGRDTGVLGRWLGY